MSDVPSTASEVSVEPQYAATDRRTQSYDGNKVKHPMKLYTFGMIEIILGGISCLLCIVSIILTVLDTSNYHGKEVCFTFISQGLWCGAFLIVTGVLGVTAKKKPTAQMLTINMATSIISSILMGVFFILSVLAGITSSNANVTAMHFVMAVLSVGGLTISVLHSAFCCAGGSYPSMYNGQAIFKGNNSQKIVGTANVQFLMVQGHFIGQPATSPIKVQSIQESVLQPAASAASGRPAQIEPTRQTGELPLHLRKEISRHQVQIITTHNKNTEKHFFVQ